MTSAAEVELAVATGADAVGVIVAPSSRRVPLDAVGAIAAAIPPLVSRVAVVVDPTAEEASLLRRFGFTLQFSGNESPVACAERSGGDPYVKVFHVGANERVDLAHCAAYAGATWMFDTRVPGRAGGTGIAFDWTLISEAVRAHRTIVSGGLTVENVTDCVTAMHPYAVDVRSGIETQGVKDEGKMMEFIAAVARARRA